MKFKKLNGFSGNANILNYSIHWEGESRSKLQREVKKFLHEYWKNHIVCEEFPCVGTRLKIDFVNFTSRVAIEVDGSQHNSYNSFFHENIFDLVKQINRDSDKQRWCILNDITLIRIKENDLPLSVTRAKEIGII